MTSYFIDRFVDDRDAKLHISDLALQRGYAIFDFLRTCNGVPLFIDDHFERFNRSARLMQLESPEIGSIKEIINELIDRNRLQQSGIKIILTGGFSPDGYSLSEPNLIVTESEMRFPEAERYRIGMKILTIEYQRQMPQVKTIDYLMGVRLQKKRIEAGAGDVLYHKNGKVSEFPRANVFIVTKEGVIVTPGTGILEGITRKKILEIATASFRVETRDVSPEEVKKATEVFLTNSSHRVFPIVQVDDIHIGDGRPGKITRKLLEDFLNLESEYLKTNSPSQ